MNVIEMMAVLLAVIGAFSGASFGYARIGTWGVALGIPGGAALGLLFIAFALFLLALVLKIVVGGQLFPSRKTGNELQINP